MDRRKNGGFSLVELMVGVTVALIGLLIIAGVLAGAKQQKETTTSGADAQTTGAVAAYLIERDARMAGYGLNLSSLLDCTIHAYDEGVSPAREFTFQLVPVTITAGTATTPDSLTFTYGSGDVGFHAPSLTQNHNGNNANYKVDNRFGFHEGDLIVVSEDGVDTDGDGRDDCTLAQVTGVPGTPGKTDNIIHNSGNYTNLQGENVPARYNKPSGLGIAYTTNAKIYNLGSMPASKTYAIDTANAQLTLLDQMTSTAAVAIAENVVFLRAQYGKDSDGDGTVDTWDQVTPSGANGWRQVLALRFAVVARSREREGETVSPPTLTLLPALTLPGGAAQAAETLDLEAALGADARNYRYKVFAVLVPLRNMLWSAE